MLDTKTANQLLDALFKLKSEMKIIQKKRNASFWKPVKIPITFQNIMSTYTKQTIDEIRQFHSFAGISSLKKSELIEALTSLLTEHLNDILSTLDQERYNLMKEAAKNGGYVNIRENFSLFKIHWWMNSGLLFPGVYNGHEVLVMPEELLIKFNELNLNHLEKVVQRNTEWLKLTYGMLYYYGVLDISTIEQLLAKYTNKEVVEWEYLQVINNSLKYCEKISKENGLLTDDYVVDAEAILKEHKRRKEIPYYPFKKSQLLLASKDDYLEMTPALRDFLNFLEENYQFNKIELQVIGFNVVHIFRRKDGLNDVLEYLQEIFELPTEEFILQLAEKLVVLHNTTRKWTLKGYNPIELRNVNKEHTPQLSKKKETNFSHGKKVGRNDPCPCGSGKKFKKCCGK
jgi:hypothetical protein